MSIGRMRQRVTLQSETQSADGAGGYTLGWTDLATLWADIVPVNGRKIYTSGHLEARITHEMTLRYRTDITADMRVSYSGRLFNIHGVLIDGGQNQFLKLLVEEGAAV